MAATLAFGSLCPVVQAASGPGAISAEGGGAALTLSFLVGGVVAGLIILVALYFGAWSSLRTRDVRVRKIAAQFPGMLFQMRRRADGHLSIPYASGGIRKLLGVAPEDVGHDAAAALLAVAPEDRERIVVSLAESARTLKPWRQEFRAVAAGGEARWVRGEAAPEARKGGATLWHGVLADISERRGIEERLRVAEERWNSALEGSGDGVWDWNIATREVFFSRAWSAMLGYDEAEVGHTLAEWETRIHPDDLAAVNAALQRHLGGETPSLGCEHRMRCRDGTWKWILSRGRVVARGSGGAPSRFIGTCSDITLRVEAERQLREKELFLRGVFDGADLAMFVVDVQAGGGFRVVAVNPAHERLTGLGSTFMCGRSLDELAPVLGLEVVEAARRKYVQCMTTGETLEYEQAFAVAGHPGWLLTRITPLEDATGRVHRIVGTALDITERKQAEERFARLTRRLEMATRAGRIGLWEYEVAGGRLSWDEMACELHGAKPPGAVSLAAWSAQLHPEDAPGAISAFRAAVDAADAFEAGYRVVRAEGAVHHLQTAARVELGAGGRVARYVGACWDVSAVREAEAGLTTARARIERLNRELHEALSSIGQLDARSSAASQAHASLLAGIRRELSSGVDRVKEHHALLVEPGRESIRKEAAAALVAQIEGLVRRIDTIIDSWQVEAGVWQPEPRAFKLAACVEAALDRVAQQAGAKRLELLHWIDPEMPAVVVGDGSRLDQMLDILLANAVQHTAFGEVEVLVCAAESMGDGRPAVRVSVRDTGGGIPADLLGRLLRPARAEESLVPTAAGPGVGLTLCRQLATRMGGALLADSEHGRGSTFTILLPLAPGPVAGEGAPEAGFAGALAGRHVLVVALNPALGAALQRWIVEWGASVASTASASAALAMAGNGFALDAVVLDANLNDAPGLARRLAATGRGSSPVPVILLQAPAASGEAESLLGVAARVTKPVRPRALREALRLVLAGAAPEVRPGSEPRPASDRVARDHDDGPGGGHAPEDGFDPTVIEQILPDDADQACNLIGRIERQFFDGDAPRLLAAAHSALERRDCAGVARAAHGLVGGLGTLGLRGASELGRAVEKSALSGDLRAASVAIPSIEAAMKRGRAIVRDWMASRFPESVP